MSLTLLHPLPDATPTDPFGWRPAIPGVRPAELHDGQDYAGPASATIRAAHSGRVTYAGWDTTGGGWMVKLSSARCTTLYLHMLTVPAVRTGDEVRAGEAIGLVGSTGASTGPHLHFILRLPDGRPVNPVPYIRKDRTMTEAEIKRIAQATAEAVLDARVKKLDGKTTSLRAYLSWSSKTYDTFAGLLGRIVKKIGA